MKILYIHQYFNTLAKGGSTRSYYLAKALVEAGHTVELITSHNAPDYRQATVDGITLHYLPVYYDNRLGFIGRIVSFIKFIWQAYRLGASLPQISYCYATSTPLTVGVIALLLKFRRNIPFCFEVRDLWPLAPVQLGVIRNPLLIGLLNWVEKYIYQKAEQIVALSPGMAQAIIGKGIDQRKIHVIPNMADCEFFQPGFGFSHQPTGKFTIAYFGAIGPVNGLETLISAAQYFQTHGLRQVNFLVVGKGKSLPTIRKRTAAYKLTNVQFIPHVNKYEMRDILARVDGVYISFASKPVLETSSPNKFFDSLAAGKLCIVNTSGWLRELVEENKCGFYASPQQPETFAARLMPYVRNPNRLHQAQRAARRLAEATFSRELLTQQFLQLFTPAVSTPVSDADVPVPHSA